MNYFLYIVRCKDNSLYTGISKNVGQRINQHNSRYRGARSLRGKTPVFLVYKEVHNTIDSALKREKEIKGWTKAKKEKLINALALS